jgi:hypothetical protein
MPVYFYFWSLEPKYQFLARSSNRFSFSTRAERHPLVKLYTIYWWNFELTLRVYKQKLKQNLQRSPRAYQVSYPSNRDSISIHEKFSSNWFPVEGFSRVCLWNRDCSDNLLDTPLFIPFSSSHGNSSVVCSLNISSFLTKLIVESLSYEKRGVRELTATSDLLHELFFFCVNANLRSEPSSKILIFTMWKIQNKI